jgi:glutamate carboxypeptidase
MAATLADAFSALPGDLELIDSSPVESVDLSGKTIALEHGQNLRVKVRPDVPDQLLFTGHMDTVFAVDHAFQQTKWLEDGVLNGPGVADMKGGIAVLLAALKALEASDAAERIGYEVIVNSDEEVGSLGSAPLIAEAARGKCAALTYEPSALPDGTLAGARPGSGNYSIVVHGRSAHAGRNPEDGRNALVAAADLALRLDGLKRDGLTVNPARIDGGSPSNVVPDLAVLRVNLRPRTPAIQSDAEREIEAAVAAVAAERDVRIDLHGGFGRPPKPMTPQMETLFGLVKEAGADLGQSIGWQSTGGVCDGNNIAACGVPVVDTMGVRGGKIHSMEEFLITQSLGERAALSALTILRIAEGRL